MDIESVKKCLRKLEQPITLYGETAENKRKRLREIEQKISIEDISTEHLEYFNNIKNYNDNSIYDKIHPYIQIILFIIFLIILCFIIIKM